MSWLMNIEYAIKHTMLYVGSEHWDSQLWSFLKWRISGFIVEMDVWNLGY